MNDLKLFRLKTIVSVYDYDVFDGHMIVAESEEKARLLCPFADEDKTHWLDPKATSCEEIFLNDLIKPEVLLSSFNAA